MCALCVRTVCSSVFATVYSRRQKNVHSSKTVGFVSNYCSVRVRFRGDQERYFGIDDRND